MCITSLCPQEPTWAVQESKKIESPSLHKSCHDWATTKKEKMPLKFEIEYLQTQELIPEQLKTVKENTIIMVYAF